MGAMTNGEIAGLTSALYHLASGAPDYQEVEAEMGDILRAFASRVYEEAALAAERSHIPIRPAGPTAAEYAMAVESKSAAAANIRTLKDSIQAEPVPS